MPSIPKPIHDTAAAFDSLPGIGPRASLRYAYWLATQHPESIKKFSQAILSLADGIKRCALCGDWTDIAGCKICSDIRRDQSLICVVASSQDIRVIEESGVYKGLYHSLGGLINPIEGRTPDTLRILPLISRVQNSNSSIQEIILALDPDTQGDMTAMYITKQLTITNVRVSRLARGLQHGAQIEYADGTTIADALSNRRQS